VTTLRCEIDYQGYKAVSGKYRRSDGLQPEPGWVLIPLEDMKEIKLHPRTIQWRSVVGVEHDGSVDIRTWDRFRKSATITADRKPSPEPASGLNMSGDLILRTYNAITGALIYPPVTYSDVYVDWGMEESTEGLANILEHKEGLVRVPLTDIRQYYAEIGSVFCRINCRRKNGAWDKDTVKEDGETPWPFGDVLDFLFSQLPGSPIITAESDIRVFPFDAPQGIEGQGEPASQIIDQLLRRYGLKAQMQPDGKYSVNSRSSSRTPRRAIATAPREYKAINPKTEMQYERMTSTPTGRASAVVCVGPRRVQRRTFSCTPILRDPATGKWHTLWKICQLWNYPYEAMRRHIFISGPRQFADCPPDPTSSFAASGLHDARRDALKMAYRQYIPNFMVNEDGDVIDPEGELVPYLPVMPETAWYKQELNLEQLRDFPKDKASKGDADDIVMFPPVVRGNVVGERYFNDFKELQSEINGVISRQAEVVASLQSLAAVAFEVGRNGLEDLLKSEEVSEETIKDYRRWGIENVSVDLEGDIRAAAKAFEVVMEKNLRVKYTKDSENAKQAVLLYANRMKEAEASIAEHESVIRVHKNKLEETRLVFAKNGRIWGRYNLGQAPTLKARVADYATGLIESSVPLCVVDRPWFFNGDDVRVIADGAVTVTYGYEIKGSGAYAYTNYLFFANDGGDPAAYAKPTFGGCHRSSPIKAKVIPMESREYITETGNPMNYNACWTEAKGKAADMCSGPAVVEGWTMELHGLRNCVLDAGIMSVQHEWDGTVGITHVAVNAPGARTMPLMAPNARPPRQVGAAELREAMQRER
jgi:hypothetical protein